MNPPKVNAHAVASLKIVRKATYPLGLIFAMSPRTDSPLILKRCKTHKSVHAKHVMPRFADLRLMLWVFDNEQDFEHMKSTYTWVKVVNLSEEIV